MSSILFSTSNLVYEKKIYHNLRENERVAILRLTLKGSNFTVGSKLWVVAAAATIRFISVVTNVQKKLVLQKKIVFFISKNYTHATYFEEICLFKINKVK